MARATAKPEASMAPTPVLATPMLPASPGEGLPVDLLVDLPVGLPVDHRHARQEDPAAVISVPLRTLRGGEYCRTSTPVGTMARGTVAAGGEAVFGKRLSPTRRDDMKTMAEWDSTRVKRPS